MRLEAPWRGPHAKAARELAATLRARCPVAALASDNVCTYDLRVNHAPVPLDALLESVRRTLPGLQGIWLFGSVAKGTAHAGSDIDLAVLGAAPFDAVQIFDLGLELGVMARRDVDLVDLRRLPIVLRKEVLTGGRLVASDAPSACASFEAESMAMYVAFRDELALANGGEGRR